MKKTYLLTPGPTPVPETVCAALSLPVPHHRTPQFQVIFHEIRQGLQKIFQTKNDVLTLASSGTGAMEAALVNLFSAGDSVIVIDAGKFGARWTQLSKVYGLKAIELKLERGKALSVDSLEQAFKSNPGVKAVLFQASETSTGAMLPTQKICEIAARNDALSVCDAITACGVFDLPMDAWGIDVLMTGSQKALMLPPGLAFISLSPKAWAARETSTLPKFYFDLKKEQKAQAKGQTSWTPATSLLIGLRESLKLIEAETLPALFARHDLLARATRAAVLALNLEIFAAECPSSAVTAVKVPSSIADGKQIPKIMRDKHGVIITGGQDELEGRIFRLSHFGYVGPFDIVTEIAGLELTLKELGHPVELGRGVGAALQIFSQN